MVTFNNTAF